MGDIAIGIDLGTTNSCVAWYKDGSVQILENVEGGRITPSYVYFLKDSNCQEVVGQCAKNMSQANPPNGIYEIKRFMGKRYSDVRNRLDYFAFDVDSDDNDNAVISIKRDNGILKASPEDVSACILKRLKADVRKKLKFPVTKAVITVPAYFNTSQREATLNAAEKAGFEVLQLFGEPTASALSYCHKNKIKNEGYLLVYDLGGGTFDVSILKKSYNDIDVLGVDGDTNLGGKDFDNCIIDYICEQLEQKYNYNPKTDRREIRRLQTICEDAKKNLSLAQKTNIVLSVMVPHHTIVDISLTRKQFEEQIQTFLDRTIKILLRCIKRCNLSTEDINDVILAGGSCRIPKIQEMLSNIFTEKTLDFTLNFDECVAEGAAIQAAILNQSSVQEVKQKLQLTEVVPLTLGIEVRGGIMSKIIERNTQIPATQTETFTTSDDLQTSVSFKVYEGERLDVDKNFYLGKLTLENLTPLPPGECKILLTLTVDKNGILSMKAFEECQKITKQIKISRNRKSDSEVHEAITNAEENEDEDKKFMEFANRKLYLFNYCELIKYNLRILGLKEELKNISDLCEKVGKKSESLKMKDRFILEDLISTTREKCEPVVKAYNFKSMPANPK